MADAQESPAAAKAKVFFDRADQVADTGNWDFAIELYLEGIRRDPDDLERGHYKLREVALKRVIQGGKKAGMMEGFKRRQGKDPAENLVNAEYFWAKEPGSQDNMLLVLKTAKALGKPALINWMGRIVLESQQAKPSKPILMLLADYFQDAEEFGAAISAIEQAQRIDSSDTSLNERLSRLSAQYTIKKGKYDQEGDFTRSVKDLDKQQELIQRDSLVQGADYLRQQIDVARAGYISSPTVAGKINAFVDALLKTEKETDDSEAIDTLAKAQEKTGEYQYRLRLGDIKIRQMTRKYRQLIEAGDKSAAIEQARKQLEFELEEYTQRAENYPTDLAIKFELGKRQYIAGNYDEAIGSLQQSQRDPRRHVTSLSYIGQSFAKKGWLTEASETYERALKAELPESKKKELWYQLADCYEKMDKLDKAQNIFSDLAQLDYNFKDTPKRLGAIRDKLKGESK